MPKVSVVLSSYNHEAYIAEAVQSVLDQTYQDFELIIYDDGSSDRSLEILQSFKDKRIRLLPFHKNRGALNVSMEIQNLVQGEYVAVHHSDDMWEPQKLEMQVEFLDTYSEYAACFTQVKFIDENSLEYRLPEDHIYANRFDQETRLRTEWLQHFFYQGNCLCHPSLLIRRECYELYDLLDVKGLTQLPDFFMWVKLCRYQNIAVLPEKLTKFRLHTMGVINMSGDSPQMRIRDAYEYGTILKEFRKIRNVDDFLQVFPDAKQYFLDGEIDLDFAFAKICLSTGKNRHMLEGLEILQNLLGNKEKSALLKEKYNYTVREFSVDTGKYDVFSLKQQMKFIPVLFYYDDGMGFNEANVFVQNVYVLPTGEFFAEFTVSKQMKSFILNVGEGHLLKMFWQGIFVDGQCVEAKPLNRDMADGQYDVFLNIHPQYQIVLEGLMDVREVTIQGMINDETGKLLELLSQEYQNFNNLKKSRRGRLFRKICEVIDFFVK